MSHKLIHPVASLILVPVLVFAGAFAPVFCRPEIPLVFSWKAINKWEQSRRAPLKLPRSP